MPLPSLLLRILPSVARFVFNFACRQSLSRQRQKLSTFHSDYYGFDLGACFTPVPAPLPVTALSRLQNGLLSTIGTVFFMTPIHFWTVKLSKRTFASSSVFSYILTMSNQRHTGLARFHVVYYSPWLSVTFQHYGAWLHVLPCSPRQSVPTLRSRESHRVSFRALLLHS